METRSLIVRLRVAQQHGIELKTSAIVIAQVWRDPEGRQAELPRLLRSVDLRPVDEPLSREAGILLGRTGTSGPIDATVVLVAAQGDRLLTSDTRDFKRLASAARKRVAIIPC